MFFILVLLLAVIGEKFRRKSGKTAQKNIAYSLAIEYITKTGDFRLQTVMLPTACRKKLPHRLTSKIRESNKKILQKRVCSESDTPFVFNYFCSNKDLNFYKADLQKEKKLNS